MMGQRQFQSKLCYQLSACIAQLDTRYYGSKMGNKFHPVL